MELIALEVRCEVKSTNHPTDSRRNCPVGRTVFSRVLKTPPASAGGSDSDHALEDSGFSIPRGTLRIRERIGFVRSSIQLTTSLTILVLFLVVCASATAQSTVFNIPSTDVPAPGKVLLEADFITHFASYKDGGYQTYGPRVVVGTPGHTEIGVNVFYTKSAETEPVLVQPNLKWQFFNNGKLGVAVATGFILTIPATNRSAGTKTALLYIVGSKSFPGTCGPRITVGGYTIAGRMASGTDRTGLLAGYEQPITKRFSVLADWFSGKNDVGYVTAATGFTLSDKDSIYAGYSFGNQGRGNNSLGIYYTRSF